MEIAPKKRNILMGVDFTIEDLFKRVNNIENLLNDMVGIDNMRVKLLNTLVQIELKKSVETKTERLKTFNEMLDGL